jgi:hypothetical protein
MGLGFRGVSDRQSLQNIIITILYYKHFHMARALLTETEFFLVYKIIVACRFFSREIFSLTFRLHMCPIKHNIKEITPEKMCKMACTYLEETQS